MAVGPSSVEFAAVPGVRLSSVACGIKKNGKHDLVLMAFSEGSIAAGVFTQSLFAAAPVQVGRRHLETAESTRYFLINSGNANAGVGADGLADAMSCCDALAKLAGVPTDSVLPFSTGVIGERLPVAKITGALDAAMADLSEDNWLDAAQGIMTTDTRPKIASRQVVIGGKTVTLTGIAKGAGMIQPNMATMLCYMATDARCDKAMLQTLLADAVEHSFNRITVDSDTSTNDSCLLVATGASGVDVSAGDAREAFSKALSALALELAQGIIRDGEGATKFVEVRVGNGPTSEVCLAIAYAIANSPLMKTAIYASDANWGRIVMAIGKAPVNIDVNKLDVYLGDVQLMAAGQKHPGYTEDAGAAVMADEEITITVDLNAGAAAETVWTSDLSHEYVRINAEYRT